MTEQAALLSRYDRLRTCLEQAVSRSVAQGGRSGLPKAYATIDKSELDGCVERLAGQLRSAVMGEFDELAGRFDVEAKLATIDGLSRHEAGVAPAPGPASLENVQPEQTQAAVRIQVKLEERERLLALVQELESERAALEQSLAAKMDVLCQSPLYALSASS